MICAIIFYVKLSVLKRDVNDDYIEQYLNTFGHEPRRAGYDEKVRFRAQLRHVRWSRVLAIGVMLFTKSLGETTASLKQ